MARILIVEDEKDLQEVLSYNLRQGGHSTVVVGSGPGGLVCAYFLALHGYRPVVLERGTKVSDRIRDVQRFDEGGPFHPESNYLFGEGGAGTFSDGKLTCRGTGPDVMRVLELLAECKGQQPGKPSILYYHRPHLGSNRLPAVVRDVVFVGETRRYVVEACGFTLVVKQLSRTGIRRCAPGDSVLLSWDVEDTLIV